MASSWRDETSYSSGETGLVPPRTWVLAAGGLRVIVTRHVADPGRWLLRCEPWFGQLRLHGTQIETAKAEAVLLVQGKLQGALSELAGVR